ncbi:MAG: shikimate dehydrogenase [Rubrobacter sp.]|nr:shikimate dehydrogenase [Rubrobacter sp.]
MQEIPDGRTRLLGVMGHPIGHSLSPRMHNAAFAAARGPDGGGLEYAYVPLDVRPGDLPDAVRGLRALGFLGFNVTMPHKAAILPLLDELDESARVAEAVNTVEVRESGLKGLNTDGSGFLEACREAGVELAGRSVLLLGAGGAAAAVAVALLREGVGALGIANRTPGRAEGLRRKLREMSPEAEVRAQGLEGLGEAVAGAEVLVNTTYLGMKDDDPLPVPEEHLRGDLVICDAVYRAGGETALVRRAGERGARTVSGGRMLLYQGVEAQRVWLGREPDVAAMSRALG